MRFPNATLATALAAAALAVLGVAPAHAQGYVAGLNYRSFEYGGVERAFYVYLPTGYSADRSRPVLFGFHGLGQNAEALFQLPGVIPALEAHQVIGVFPQGLGPRGGEGGSWNAASCCGFAREAGVDDIGFVRALAETLAAHLATDERRFYALGSGNGAMLAHRVGSELSDRFAAIASYGGGIGGKAHALDAERRIEPPAMPVHVLAMYGALAADPAREFSAGADGRLGTPPAETEAFWASAMGGQERPQVVLRQGGNVVIRAYQTQRRVDVMAVLVKNAGQDMPTTADHGYDAMNEMIEFLVNRKKQRS